MHKYRVPVFITSILGVLGITWILIQLGNGYRPNFQNRTVALTGLMVTNSEPKGAQVIINGEVRTATDDTLNLEPGSYQVELKKNGFFPWSKTLQIEPSLVTQTNATLFPSTTDLKAITYTGVINPSLSPNGSRIIYAVSNEATSSTDLNPDSGIWILELSDLPLRFNRDPQQIVAGLPDKINPSKIQFKWSYDSQEIVVLIPVTSDTDNSKTTKNSKLLTAATPEPEYKAYRFPIQNNLSHFTNDFLVNDVNKILKDWQTQANIRLSNQLSELPNSLRLLLATSSAELSLSPDETKILYTATTSAELENQYIPPVLSASSQQEIRTLTPQHKYIYDIKEDKNFDFTQSISKLTSPKINWFTNSRHVIISTLEGVYLLEYDNTNFTTIYSGPLSNSNVFPHPSGNRILIETTLNPKANSQTNLYAIVLR